ncbi:MAG: Efflux transporter, RND family, MFP subunit [Parcubacteria group bacterium GW2011_GWA2_42_14]|nr:MAG: Efflux transporter, RND family, MFP subunit [Parcubacteria group bacterium GW2011_GWA2_42_14]OHA00074.1 MAG: hypothetical protein A3D41_03965 [Candidatus Sungbacteria bacterium RIFCSPHIGHO2_02_FULL_41_12b]
MISKLLAQLIKHKFTAGILLLLVAGGGYWGYAKIFSNDGAVRYATAQVQNGTLIVSISGNGQVSASNQLDVKPKANGEITALYVKLGQEVGSGATLAVIDASDAERAVRDAETAFETAKLELDKLLEPLDELTLLQAENSLIQAKSSKKNSEYNLKKAYEDGFNTVANAFLDLPSLMVGLQDILYGTTLALGGQPNLSYYADSVKNYDEKILEYKDDASMAYQKARLSYDKNFQTYKSAGRFSDTKTVESLIDETYENTKNIAEAIKITNDLIQFYQDKLAERLLKPNTISNTHLSTLSSYTGKTNSTLSGLLSIKQTIQDSKDAIVSAERSIEEKELSLTKTKEGPDDLDIRAKKITIQQKEDAFITAKQTLSDHYVKSPFAGVIAKVNAKKGDSASASTIIATLITKQRIAEISLNEVDVSKVKAGQKVTITFDAIEGLSITGEVAEIDSVGVIAQGVVTYGVKIELDTEDERVKPSMSVSAAIITEVRQNALIVPNSAVKQQGDTAYVEIYVSDTQTPLKQNVQVGLSNDTSTEILSGLNEGERVVTQTINTSGAAQTQTQQNSSIRIPGITRGGGGGGPRGGGGGIRR